MSKSGGFGVRFWSFSRKRSLFPGPSSEKKDSRNSGNGNLIFRALLGALYKKDTFLSGFFSRISREGHLGGRIIPRLGVLPYRNRRSSIVREAFSCHTCSFPDPEKVQKTLKGRLTKLGFYTIPHFWASSTSPFAHGIAYRARRPREMQLEASTVEYLG